MNDKTYTRAEILELLNGPDRLNNLRNLAMTCERPQTGRDVNNHIHTTYSFSPYSPTAAAFFAWRAGLCTCGLMDHDSIAGAREFLEAAHILKLGATIGVECRVSFLNTPFAGRRINNPDQNSVVYMALHGVPHDQIDRIETFFAPYRAHRNARNRKMTDAVNALLKQYGVFVDFDADVLPLSQAARGGTVTERHIASALAYKLLDKFPRHADLVAFLRDALALPLSAKLEGYLLDDQNPHAMYDLLGLIKSNLIARFYIDATDECPDVRDVLALSESVGAISAYAYLGDVGDSVTGDKRAQKFEDDYLDELFAYLKFLGYRAVTYMPSRNTRAQLARVRGLCEQYGLMQISGEDINSPRQSFVCEAQRDPAFANLFHTTWALIAHEWRSTEDHEGGLFSKTSVAAWPKLDDRIAAFSKFGQDE